MLPSALWCRRRVMLLLVAVVLLLLLVVLLLLLLLVLVVPLLLLPGAAADALLSPLPTRAARADLTASLRLQAKAMPRSGDGRMKALASLEEVAIERIEELNPDGFDWTLAEQKLAFMRYLLPPLELPTVRTTLLLLLLLPLLLLRFPLLLLALTSLGRRSLSWRVPVTPTSPRTATPATRPCRRTWCCRSTSPTRAPACWARSARSWTWRWRR